jgi:menaquinone-dependent protoporphyrinogen oxidase
MKVLIIYATTEGHTRKIAEHIGDRLHALDVDVDLHDATDSSPAVDFVGVDAAIVAGSLHDGRYQSSLSAFARTHRDDLNARENAFVSVSLAAASPDAEDIANLEVAVRRFASEVDWRPGLVEHVMGSLRWSKTDYFRRCVVKCLAPAALERASLVCELTDWVALTRFVDTFVAEAKADRLRLRRARGDLAKTVKPRQKDLIRSLKDDEPLRAEFRQGPANGLHR